MIPTLFSSLLSDLWDDVQNADVVWQIGAILLCIVIGWALARLLRRWIAGRGEQQRIVRLGVESFTRILSPLLIFLLLLVAKPLLAHGHHTNLLRVAIPLAASQVLIRLGFYILRRAFKRQGQVGNFLRIFERLFAALIWVGVALYITGSWDDLLQYLDDTLIPIGSHKVSLQTVLQAVVSVIVTLTVALWAGAALDDRLMRVDTLHSSTRVVISRMGTVLLIVLAVLLSLSMVGIDPTVLSVFGGALGVGLGLGLRTIASNYVSGFVVLIERRLAIGDMITVDKYYGKIAQINARYTVLQGQDGVEHVIPNEMLISSPVQKASTDVTLSLKTAVSVSYQTDIDMVLQLLTDAAASVTRVSKEPAPSARLANFGADGLELEVSFAIPDPEIDRGNVASDVNRAIWRSFQQHRISVPYPQREIRIFSEELSTK
jgi:small-conductance mechanosensitive channel